MNGTWINGRKLDVLEQCKLYGNDLINFGFQEHPECNGIDNHYCYLVVQRTKADDMDTGELLKILQDDTNSIRGDDSHQNQAQKNECEVEPIVVIKQEPCITGFSNRDEVIVIDDDEDFDIACSQAFNSILDKAKSDANEDHQVIEIPDSEDEEFDIFDLLNGIESSRDCGSIVSTTENFELANREGVNNNEDPEDERYETPEPISPEVTEHAEVNVERSESAVEKICIGRNAEDEYVDNENEINVLEEEVDEEGESSTIAKTVIDRSFICKSKYHVPEIIEPHVIAKDRKGRKRKRSISIEIEEKKKKLIENIKNETKSKSKRVYRRRKSCNQNRNDNVRRTDDESSKSPPEPANSTFKPDPPKIQSSNPPKLIIKPKATEGNNSNGSMNKKVPRAHSATLEMPAPAPLRDPRLAMHSMRTNGGNEEMNSQLRCHVGRKMASPVGLAKQYPIMRRPSRDLAFAIVRWCTMWLSEQKTVNKCPPIHDGVLIRMCMSFYNHPDYVKVVEPFIKMEIWYQLTQGFETSNRNR